MKQLLIYTLALCLASAIVATRSFGKTDPLSKINRIQQAISTQKENIKSSEEQEVNLLNELQRLDNELKIGQDKLIFLQERLLRQENHILDKEREIESIQNEKNTISKHVENRLRSFYQMDDISLVNTLFSATTLPELLNLKQYFQSMFQYDQQVLKKYSVQIQLLAGARAEILKEKDKLLDLIIEAQDQEASLISARLERKELLSRVQTEEQLYRRALKEITDAANKLTKQINALHKKVIRSQKRKIARFKTGKKVKPAVDVDGFSTMKGRLLPPVTGKVITYFGTHLDKFNQKISSSGINIETFNLAEVKAVYDGVIVHTGDVEGYGNMVIIDHGNQYHTLVSGLSSIVVSDGDQVITGQQIGSMGNSTPLLSPGLHMEIRHDSNPVDPLLWIDTNLLQPLK